MSDLSDLSDSAFIKGCYQASVCWTGSVIAAVTFSRIDEALQDFCETLKEGDVRKTRSRRCRKMLCQLGIATWGELEQCNFNNIRSTRNFGEVSYLLLVEVAAQQGLKIRRWC